VTDKDLSADTTLPSSQPDKPDVPLAPACLVVGLLMALFFSVMMVAAAWLLMGRQADTAMMAIERQLIPWVEQSNMAEPDRREVVAQLELLCRDIAGERYESRQVERLGTRLRDNPLFLWGLIQQLQERIEQSTLTEPERASAAPICDRMLEMAARGLLDMSQLDFVVQEVALRTSDQRRLVIREETPPESLRLFLRRASLVADQAGIPTEVESQSLADALRRVLQEAVDLDRKLAPLGQ
jgi:hypothetical protein